MSKAYKPEGYSSVSAYLVVRGAQAVIEFLGAAFDARQLRRYEREDGSIMHAEVQIDDSVVMIADGDAEHPASANNLHVYVADVDATYQRAIQASGEAVRAPIQQADDPDRRGGVRDPAGNTWWIATQVDDEG